MYNGIGLTTPRGSGTNGYVIRNLSVLRHHETAEERAAAWDVAPAKHREPDAEILEHERKRKVEVRCMELRLQLEDKEVDEEKIEEEVDALRKLLLDELSNTSITNAKHLKPSDTHAIAAAKKRELEKMAAALGTRRNYEEGEAFDREKQAENKAKAMIEREGRERQREEERARFQKQKEQWEAEKRERDRLRRREEDRLRKLREQEKAEGDRMPPPSGPRGQDRERVQHRPDTYRGEKRSRSPSRRPTEPRAATAAGNRGDVRPPRPNSRSSGNRRGPPPPPRRFNSRSPPPVARPRGRAVSRTPSRSPSPPRHRRSEHDNSGRYERRNERASPPRKRGRAYSRTPTHSQSRSRSHSHSPQQAKERIISRDRRDSPSPRGYPPRDKDSRMSPLIRENRNRQNRSPSVSQRGSARARSRSRNSASVSPAPRSARSPSPNRSNSRIRSAGSPRRRSRSAASDSSMAMSVSTGSGRDEK